MPVVPVANNSCRESVPRLYRAQSSRSLLRLSCAIRASRLRSGIGWVAYVGDISMRGLLYPSDITLPWQGHSKLRAASRLIFGACGPPVACDEMTDDRESKPGASGS